MVWPSRVNVRRERNLCIRDGSTSKNACLSVFEIYLGDDESPTRDLTDIVLKSYKTKMRELQEEEIQIDLADWCSNAAQEASLADCAILDVRNRSAGHRKIWSSSRLP